MPHLPLDLERFWRDNDVALRDPFGAGIPQAAMGIRMTYETVFAELGHAFDMRRLERDYDFARSAAQAYNQRAREIVGRPLLDEQAYDPSRRFPRVTSLGEIFGCRLSRDQWSEWLHPAAGTPAELARLLDRVETLELRERMFPPAWHAECRRIQDQHGTKPRLGRHLRGPVTLAASIYGAENLIFLILDDRPLAERFRDVLRDRIIEYFRICDEVSGERYGYDGKPLVGGFGFADDNCALLTPDMYAFFGQPVVQAVFDQFASRPADRRYQHSDSDMGHLLPQLAETGLNRVNFGPKVRFRDIRAAMPHAIVDGTLSPLTFMSNDDSAIAAEVRRDLDEARRSRGLVEATAGSVNNGTRLTSLRTVMAVVQSHGRYAQG